MGHEARGASKKFAGLDLASDGSTLFVITDGHLLDGTALCKSVAAKQPHWQCHLDGSWRSGGPERNPKQTT